MKIVIDRVLSPKGVDVAFSPVDMFGNQGTLNGYVLRELGGYLPSEKELEPGMFIVHSESGVLIYYIVTVGRESTRYLLLKNLKRAFNYPDIANNSVWIPLLGTGVGGLSYEESFDTILTALSEVNEVQMPQTLFISVPDDTTDTELIEYHRKANQLIEVVRLMDEVDEAGNPTWVKNLTSIIKDDNRSFYAVGTSWGGRNMLPDFKKNGYWEIGDDKLGYVVNRVKSNDIIIAKSTFPGDGRGYFRVKAFGIVENNVGNGRKLEVRWINIRDRNVDIPGKLSRLRHRIAQISWEDVIEIFSYLGDFDALVKAGLFQKKNELTNTRAPKHRRSEAISTDHGSQDALGFMKDVQSLAALIALKEMKPPLAIALFGKWGSGKSFFMENLEQRIRELSKYQGFLEGAGEISDDQEQTFLSGIAHIKFNAWSYMDANLWAGLAHSLFEKLDQYIADNTRGEKERLKVQSKINERLEFLRSDLEVEQGKLEELEKAKRRLEQERENKLLKFFSDKYDQRTRRFLKYHGVEEELDILVPSKLRRYVERSINLVSYLRGNRYQVTVWILSIIAIVWMCKAIFMPILSDTNWLTSILKSIWTYTTLTVLPIIGIIGKFIYDYRKVLSSLLILSSEEKELRKNDRNHYEKDELKEAIYKTNTEIINIESKIQQEERNKRDLNDVAIRSVISEAPKNDEYLKHLGIITTIRKDFETLSDLFSDKEKEINPTLNEKEQGRIRELNKDREEISQAFTGEGNRKLNRIVLYIDDLDRCTDDKVLEVLQAVHLLMAFPLFTVVVGVDERSVHNALKYGQLKRYQNLDKRLVDRNIREIEPREYLEKIFQLPFQLPEATNEGVEQLIDYIIPNPEIEDTEIEDKEKEEKSKTSEEHTGKDGMGVSRDNFVREEKQAYSSKLKTIKPDEIRITESEKRYLKLFAPLVGNNPRTVKRYVNIFRIVKTHELDIFDEDKASIKIAFLVAFYTGKYREIAREFLRDDHGFRLNAFLLDKDPTTQVPLEDGKLLTLIESMQQEEEGVTSILHLPREEHTKLFKFVERFSYKLDVRGN